MGSVKGFPFRPCFSTMFLCAQYAIGFLWWPTVRPQTLFIVPTIWQTMTTTSWKACLSDMQFDMSRGLLSVLLFFTVVDQRVSLAHQQNSMSLPKLLFFSNILLLADIC